MNERFEIRSVWSTKAGKSKDFPAFSCSGLSCICLFIKRIAIRASFSRVVRGFPVSLSQISLSGNTKYWIFADYGKIRFSLGL